MDVFSLTRDMFNLERTEAERLTTWVNKNFDQYRKEIFNSDLGVIITDTSTAALLAFVRGFKFPCYKLNTKGVYCMGSIVEGGTEDDYKEVNIIVIPPHMFDGE